VQLGDSFKDVKGRRKYADRILVKKEGKRNVTKRSNK
jgi:hypothetical protein